MTSVLRGKRVLRQKERRGREKDVCMCVWMILYANHGPEEHDGLSHLAGLLSDQRE